MRTPPLPLAPVKSKQAGEERERSGGGLSCRLCRFGCTTAVEGKEKKRTGGKGKEGKRETRRRGTSRDTSTYSTLRSREPSCVLFAQGRCGAVRCDATQCTPSTYLTYAMPFTHTHPKSLSQSAPQVPPPLLPQTQSAPQRTQNIPCPKYMDVPSAHADPVRYLLAHPLGPLFLRPLHGSVLERRCHIVSHRIAPLSQRAHRLASSPTTSPSPRNANPTCSNPQPPSQRSLTSSRGVTLARSLPTRQST